MIYLEEIYSASRGLRLSHSILKPYNKPLIFFIFIFASHLSLPTSRFSIYVNFLFQLHFSYYIFVSQDWIIIVIINISLTVHFIHKIYFTTLIVIQFYTIIFLAHFVKRLFKLKSDMFETYFNLDWCKSPDSLSILITHCNLFIVMSFCPVN